MHLFTNTCTTHPPSTITLFHHNNHNLERIPSHSLHRDLYLVAKKVSHTFHQSATAEMMLIMWSHLDPSLRYSTRLCTHYHHDSPEQRHPSEISESSLVSTTLNIGLINAHSAIILNTRTPSPLCGKVDTQNCIRKNHYNVCPVHWETHGTRYNVCNPALNPLRT